MVCRSSSAACPACEATQQEGQLVVFRGGWADLEYWGGGPSDEPVLEAPGWDDRMDLPAIERLLRRFAGLFD